jgi:hypothetical protein
MTIAPGEEKVVGLETVGLDLVEGAIGDETAPRRLFLAVAVGQPKARARERKRWMLLEK